MKIAKLTIQNFKAFYGDPKHPYIIDFRGKDSEAKSLLIYGENGSGKSSLYWALHHIVSDKDSRWFKKYKNIFANEQNLPIWIDLQFDDGSNYRFFESTGITITPSLSDEFIRLRKIKTFLSYESLFLVNDLFTKEISIERFVYILDEMYGESIHDKLESYQQLRRKFKYEYNHSICDFKEMFESFIEDVNIDYFINKIMSSHEYNDIPKLENEKEKELNDHYETVYYFSEELISQLQYIYSVFTTLRDEFDINDPELDYFVNRLDDLKEFLEGKSKESYDQKLRDGEIFTINEESIETIDELNHIETYFRDVFTIYNDYMKAKEIASEINDVINEKLATQIPFINDVIKNYFKIPIEISQDEYTQFLLFDPNKNFDSFTPLRLQIIYADHIIPYNHTKFFNEAKISSINFIFYLSIVKSYAELHELKLLVFDDLLLSLDMSNRDMVLNLIFKEFPDFQIIFMTHDKVLYEMMKQKISIFSEKKWKFFEFYYTDIDGFEKPFIVKQRDYFEKAEYYFIKYDYSACANYLRKEAERLLKNIACSEGDLLCHEINNLQKLINKAKTKGALKDKEKIIETVRVLSESECLSYFLKYDISLLPSRKDKEMFGKLRYELKKLDTYTTNEMEGLEETLESLEKFKALILNPQSHDDVNMPIYRKELNDALNIIQKLKDLIRN